MIDRETPADEHLQAQRERGARNTVVRSLRWLLVVCLAGCPTGGKRTDTYVEGQDVQADCCEHLQGTARDHCLSEIVRVDDPQAAGTTTNQATYSCVVEHFVCDPATGKPTQTSAQAQYDCIEDQGR